MTYSFIFHRFLYILQAKVVAHEGTSHAEDISVDKYLKAWFSPSGNFLAVAPMPDGKQSGQRDSIGVKFTVPSDMRMVTFYYKVNNYLSDLCKMILSSYVPPPPPAPFGQSSRIPL